MQSESNGNSDHPPQSPSVQHGDVHLAYARPTEKPSTSLADSSIRCALGGAVIFVAGGILFDADGLAVGACVGAVLGFLGVLLGTRALRRIKADPYRHSGEWLAVSGIALGGLSAVFMILIVAVVLPSMERAHAQARIAASLANLRSVGTALHDYASLHSVHPDHMQVLTTLQALDARELHDPARGDPTSTCDYYYVTELKPDDPPDWIIGYCDPAYHDAEGGCILYLDGTPRWEVEPRFSQQLQRFRDAYEQSRGVPPTMLPPDAPPKP